MKNFTMKTFNDSYLYSNKVAHNAENPKSKNDKAILDFIVKSHRIEKYDKAFSGVIEDIKRVQTSAVLLSVLMNDNVILCINESPLPRAFTVFDAYDSKSGGKPKVFIDVTGRIDYKDGYYVARRNEIDKICALLLDAMNYLLYRYYHNNLFKSTVVLNATACYVSMFAYILDYLRVIGYSQNKNKIAYVVGLYFLKSHIGLELDDYNKSIAAKVAGINAGEAKAYHLYIESEDMFTNIGTFLPALIQTFRLKGLDIPTFVSRWMKSFGTGSEYAIEVFTSFANLVMNAYTGCYMVAQRQIELACGSDTMTKFCSAIIRTGAECLNVKGYMRESKEVHSLFAKQLAESINLKNNLNENDLVVKSFNDKEKALNEAKDIICTCGMARITDKLNIYASNSIAKGISVAYEHCIGLVDPNYITEYESGALTNISKAFKNKITDKQRYELETVINRDINQLREIVRESELSKETKSIISKTILEFIDIQKYF